MRRRDKSNAYRRFFNCWKNLPDAGAVNASRGSSARPTSTWPKEDDQVLDVEMIGAAPSGRALQNQPLRHPRRVGS
jgi:hypothetical protein